MINLIIQWVNYLILWSKKTDVITIIPPNMKKMVGTSPNTKKVNIIPMNKIGLDERGGTFDFSIRNSQNFIYLTRKRFIKRKHIP